MSTPGSDVDRVTHAHRSGMVSLAVYPESHSGPALPVQFQTGREPARARSVTSGGIVTRSSLALKNRTVH